MQAIVILAIIVGAIQAIVILAIIVRVVIFFIRKKRQTNGPLTYTELPQSKPGIFHESHIPSRAYPPM